MSWLRQVVRRSLAAALPRRVFLTHGPASGRSVALTFDDGPDPELTPRLLDVLADLGVPATFFLIGERAEKCPEVVRRIAAEGHAIGSHTYSHPMRASQTAAEAAAEVTRGIEAIGGVTGTAPTLFRPPRGKVTAKDLWRLWRAGLTTVLWNVDPKDYNKATADEVRDWFRGKPFRGGDVVLFHDNHPHALDVLPELVAGATADGLGFVTVEAWTK